MANKFGLGSLSLETKKPNTTAWINNAKPYFVDQIGDTLQGDIDMNNFKVTNLKSPENDNDAVHKKYLREQINSIELNKNQLEDKISNVKRFFKRQPNNKNFVNDTKLQQETETPPSMNIIRNPEPQKEYTINYQFLRATDFEYVKRYFVSNSYSLKHSSSTNLFTSIDIHKSQQDKEFIIFSSIIERNVGTEVGGIYTFRCSIKINIEKPKFSVHLNKINDSKEQISFVSVEVYISKPEIIITDHEKIKHGHLTGQPIVDVKHFPSFALSEIHLI
ncbi:hypothetical protein LOTGIDRAFT_165352 [Lottia gigantea]|uniref:Uncharacterized protein n=1 Tax=Lottia gigantea TaxID=225164 RepID=V4BIW1_LOTGI|nr:hypothetical protein LOTGIDRAFT_165352 [Lottia gigantea]ESO88569.1 hypothetical protein LOTGIDRAFT_165352 [Lottia gigantea]